MEAGEILMRRGLLNRGQLEQSRGIANGHGDGTKLIGDGETFFVGGNDGSEKFSGEFVPEMIEEIFAGAADAAMIIGRAQNDDIGPLDASLEF